MAWIRTIDPGAAQGLLKTLYDEAVARAGKVFNIVRLQSLRPRVLRASIQLYVELMRSADGALSRAQREMIATVVSHANGCHYWTREHSLDLRAEVQGRPHGDALVAAMAEDYRRADLSEADRAMLDFAVKLTRAPSSVAEADVLALRARGFDDAAILDIVQITALFNYYNRLADGLGIDPEP